MGNSGFRSATLKLTLFYMAIIVAISLIFSGVLYAFVDNQFSQGLNHAYKVFDPDHNNDNDGPPQPDQDIANRTHDVWLSFVVFNAAIIFLASGGSYVLARRTLQPLEEAHETETRFTADASHELRTPLAAIKAETEVALLDKKAHSKSLRQTLKSNLEEITRLETLTNNLLNLSKLDKRQAENFGILRFDELTKKAAWQVEPLAKTKKIKITSQLNATRVRGDQQMLMQLIIILLDNSIKYSDAEQPIDINIRKTAHHAELTITDHGQGIGSRDLPHVFERFYRANHGRSQSERPGFGLGLPLAKQITELHDGSIELASKPGKGTTATVKIPLA